MYAFRSSRYFPSVILCMLPGLVSVPATADFEAGQQAFQAGDYALAFSEWRVEGARGHARSLFQLGQMYEKGQGVSRSPYTAFVLYRVAHQAGNAPAEDAANRVAGELAGGDLARGVVDSERLYREKKYLPPLPGAPLTAASEPAPAPAPKKAMPGESSPPASPVKPQPAATPPPVSAAAAATTAPRTAGAGRAYDLKYACAMQLRYQDQGSGGVHDLALFEPAPEPGYFVLGGYAQSNYDNAHGCAASIRPRGQGAERLLSAPQRWERVWKDKGTGSRMDGSIWRAMPPSDEYVCLGHVGQTGYETPYVPGYRCVHRCLVHAMPPVSPLWTTERTGAEAEIAVYILPHLNSFIATPRDQPPREILDLNPSAECR
ncbi:MAG: Vps62-related protein [Gammaproteobacteria bacterium]|nr:Vps62-related protein [Gammaproteobacteria bacterium]